MATLSVLGLYHFDPRIFDRLLIPAGMDREALIGELLAECAELEVIYPDWDIMAMSIGFWSRTMLPSWTRAWDALQAEYNPLWNVDATIRELETRDLADSDVTLYGKKDTIQHSGTVTNTGTIKDTGTQKNGGTVTNTGTIKDTGTQGVSHNMAENSSSETKKPGFNSTTQVTTESVTGNHEITAEQATTTNDLTRTDNLTRTDDLTRTDNLQRENNLTETDSRRFEDQLSGTDTRNGTDTGTILRETERHGNIGVTSSQQLVKEEMEIAELNLYRMIIDQFRTRFCLLIY